MSELELLRCDNCLKIIGGIERGTGVTIGDWGVKKAFCKKCLEKEELK